MAICDAHYVFMVADIDIYGFNNDSRRLRYSLKGQSFFENKTNKKMYHIFSYSRREYIVSIGTALGCHGIPDEQLVFSYHES